MVDLWSPQNHPPRFCSAMKAFKGNRKSSCESLRQGASHHPPPLHTHLCAGWSPPSWSFFRCYLVHTVCLQDCWREAREEIWSSVSSLVAHFCFFHLWKNQQCRQRTVWAHSRCARAGDEDSMGASCLRLVMRQDRGHLQENFPTGRFFLSKDAYRLTSVTFFWFYHPVISTDIWLSIL